MTEYLKYLNKRTVYQTIPVYNLNWIRSPRIYEQILHNRKINVVDVGARNVSLEELQPLRSFIDYIGFDADEAEVARLNSEKSKFSSSRFIAKYVAGHTGTVDFLLHKDAGDSSVYRCDNVFSSYYHDPEVNPIDRTVNLSCDTLDNLLGRDFDVDVIKLDTQGSEFEILSGASSVLTSAFMVEIEVEFVSVYKGQKLAHHVMERMTEQGFNLLYLNRVYGSSRRYQGLSRGQLIFGDALFGLSRESVQKLTPDKKIKYCCLLINYGHYDFAYDLYLDNKDIQLNSPELKEFFEKVNKKTSNLSKLVKYIIDKIVFVLLNLRHTNGLNYDSDRSWPIR
jgi:FkbM family methyltransferase